MTTCKHCGAAITHYRGSLWHDASIVFPQYCFTHEVAGSRLHEPADPIPEGKTYTIDEVIAGLPKS